MLDFCDAPYRFFPGRPSAAIMWLSRQFNRRVILPGRNHRVRSIDVRGEVRAVTALRSTGARLCFVANHSTHSDPQALSEVQRRLGIVSCYMAAYDVFLRGRLQAWIMQRNGAFSVDREGGDRKSMNAAVEVLAAGRHALSIFPEGNVYFTNDRVEPFLDGAAFIALKAQKDLGEDQPLFIVPVALKFTHLTDVRDAVRAKLARVAASVGDELAADRPIADEIMRIGRELLARHLRHRGHLAGSDGLGDQCLFEAIPASAERIVTGLEARIGLAPRQGDSVVERLRRVRTAIHQVRVDPAREADHRAAMVWADEAMLALRILTYASPYVSGHPSLDRVAETVEKLHEDLFSRPERPIADRHVLAEVRPPIPIVDYIERFRTKARGAVVELTRDMERSVQDGLDAANAANSCPGAALF